MTTTIRIESIEPTVFFVREGDNLRQRVLLTLHNQGEAVGASLELRAEGVAETIPLGIVPGGQTQRDIYLPDIRQPQPVTFRLLASDVLQEERTLPWQPQKHWEVHLIQYAHHDLGYTDLPSNVLEEYDGFMDQVLRFCEETADWPEEDARFSYLCEQHWSVEHWLQNRGPEAAERLAYWAKRGQIEVTALFGNQTLELCSHEELVRLMYPAFRLKRELGIPITSAEHNDIPGFTWGLASVLAGAGIRYFSPGVPPWYFGRGAGQVHPLWDTKAALPLGTPAACWWEGPDGARVLLWSDLHGGEWQPYDYDQAMSELPVRLRDLDDVGYLYDMVSYTLRGGHRDNAPPTIRYAYLVREWNRRWAYPRLINTTNTPFLRAFEQRWGHTLKTLRGDVPGTDYSAAASCTPQETAVDRNTHDWLLNAEKLATLAAAGGKYAYPRTTIERAYRDTFRYDLHCWGFHHIGGPALDGEWSEKASFAYRAAALAHDVTVKATNVLADQIAYPDEGYYLTVFNPLGHARDDLVRAPLRPWSPCGSPMYWRPPQERYRWPALANSGAVGRPIVEPPLELLEQPFRLIDAATGAELPFQIHTLTDPQTAEPWAPERVAMGKVDPRHLHELVFAAEDLPSLGYRSYRIVPCEAWPTFASGATVTESASSIQVENAFYRLHLDTKSGLITSLFDKELGRELVDGQAAHGLGQFIVRSSATLEEEPLRITDARVTESGPLVTTLRMRGETPACPRVTIEVTLYHTVKRVDLAVRMLRDSTPNVEVYLAFPFAVDEPQFRFEAGGSVIEPLRDQWPGSNTDYYGVHHWADVHNQDWGITWTTRDTPMAEFGGLWPGYVSEAHHGVRGPGYGHPFLRPGELTRGHVYALVSYNNFRTNFINAHPGESVVRYALTSHRGDWREGGAPGWGWNASTPPLTVWMRGPQEGTLPASESFCQLDAANVMLLTLKEAEDGDGYVLRLFETEGRATTVRVTLPYLSVLHALETNLVEENQRVLPCDAHSTTVTLQPFGLRTLRVRARL